jgi:hypothetical protein
MPNLNAQIHKFLVADVIFEKMKTGATRRARFLHMQICESLASSHATMDLFCGRGEDGRIESTM